jgi:signal recognition particle receptor subunit beta
MVQINFAQKQINAKIVYYGPGMSGKTTNLEVVHQRAPEHNRGDLTSISTDGDRTLFFDYMPLDLGSIAGMRTCFQMYTVPGQVYYNSTRKLVLQGVDGVIFVADSGAGALEANIESLRNLEENLNEYGKSLATLPHVIQFNKRDLDDAMSLEQLAEALNLHGAAMFEAVASTGQGVFPTLKGVAQAVLKNIQAECSGGSGSPGLARTGFHARPALPKTQPAPAPRGAAPAPAPAAQARPAAAPATDGLELAPRAEATAAPAAPQAAQVEQQSPGQLMQPTAGAPAPAPAVAPAPIPTPAPAAVAPAPVRRRPTRRSSAPAQAQAPVPSMEAKAKSQNNSSTAWAVVAAMVGAAVATFALQLL